MKRFGNRIAVLLAGLFLLCSGSARAAETVCIECHGVQSGRLEEPVGQWRGSIHASMGVSCHGCHGGDPADMAMAMSPERGFVGVPSDEEIPAFCGRCHVGVAEDYMASAHGEALGAGGPQCVSCHGNHAILRSSVELINPEACSRCHSYGQAGEIRDAVAGTDGEISRVEGEIAALARLGFATRTLEEGVFSLRNTFHRLFHSVDVEKVRGGTAEVRASLEPLRVQIEERRDEVTRRRIFGGVLVALLVVAGLLAQLIYRSYREERP